MNDPGQREHRPTATGLIEPRRTSGPLPLSFAQERLWFLAQLEPESIAYHVPMVSELTGDLDVAALEWSLGRIVLRHEALRTVFEETPDGPRQLVRPWTGFDLPVEDLRHAEDQEQELARAQAEHARTPFDLAAGPLLRGRLLRLGERRHQLLLCVHHIVFDAWSHGVLNRELSALYTARVRGTEPDLPEPPVQYGDFALWQAAGQPGEETAALLDYWKVQLAGVSPVLQLPTDRPRPALQSYHGDLYEFDLPQELVDRLRALRRTHRVTMFMTVLAAFQLVLSRHTGRRDFLLGAPSANRGQPELDQLIGFFVNTLVLRADLRDDPTFAELLERVSETCLGAFEHQGTPFEQLVEELAPARDLSYNPLVQVLFAFQGDDGEQLSLPGVDLRTVRRQDASAKFDLTLRVKIGSDRSRAAIAFNADLFDRGTVARLAHHLRTALSAAAAAPDTRISEIEILDEDERHRTLVEWNSYGGELESATALHLLVEQQARRTPDAVAVQDGQRTLTYRALDERANRAAWLLRGAGVTTGSVVGVCAQRSVEMIVAVLGVLKAGAAYLPLDPDHPEARLRHLLEDAAVPAVLAQARFADRLAAAAGDGVPVLALTPDGDSPAEKSARGDAPGLPVHPDGLAYVIYTSGSTGRPKGVGVGHRAIVNNLLWMQRDWPLGPEDRLLHKTQFTFDVSVKELFWPLLAGARLVMADPDGHRDPAYLRELIVREQITVTHFVPSMLQAFLSEPGVEDCRSLRLVMCGAETLTVRQRDEFFRLLSAELLHLYGPTEAAIAVTAWTCERDPGTVRIPLGRPMPGCRIYVLDERMQPAPVGVPGELHIAGTPLALGYLGQATRTAESFVPDPFADVPGGRLYRTGDVARWRPDGLLEFIGRADAQVKIRGLRIEPGEVETVLRGDPAVEEAVVLVRTDGPAAVGPQLVAYVRGREPGRVTADSVRAYLRDRVPDYLVPAAVLVLADLPRLSSGKVDRNALPQPDWDRSGRDRTAPRTATERELLAIWCEVLGITEAGVHDNFFDLGGDSLLSIQVVARARRAQLSFTVRHMFRHQTVAALAATLQADTPAGGTPATAQPAAGGEVPLTPGQHRLLQQPATALTARVRVLELAAEVSAGQLAEALAALTARHDALRIRVERSGTAWRQTLTEGTLPVPLRVAGPSADGPADPAASAAALRTAVDPASGQPLHAALHPRDGRPSLLLLAAHPLAVDEASWPVLLADLAGLLAAAADGRPVPPPVGGPSFAAGAQALADHARSPQARTEALYWTAAAAGPVAALPLEPSGEQDGPRTARHSVRLDRAATAALTAAAGTPGPDPADLLLTAFLDAVADWTGATRHRVDLEGRVRGPVTGLPDLARTVGPFDATHPLDLDLGASPRIADRLAEVRRQRAAVPGHGLGHGVLRHLRSDTTSRTLRAARPAQLAFSCPPLDLAAGPQGPQLRPDPAAAPDPAEADTGRALRLSIRLADGEPVADWTYRADLIPSATVHRLAAHWQDAVHRATAADGEGVADGGTDEGVGPARTAAVAAGPDEDDPLLVLAEPSPTAPKVVLIHPVAGHLRGYTALVRRLGGTVSLYGMLAPGLAGECAPLESVPAMAERYVSALHRNGITGPYRLVGWSFGGLVAFEMASQLTAAGHRVALTATIDSAAPATATITDERAIGLLFAEEAARAVPGGAARPVSEQNLDGLDGEGIALLVARMLAHSRGEQGEDWLPEVRSLYQVYRANMLAAAAYRPAVYPGDLLSVVCPPGEDEPDRTADWPRFAAGTVSRLEIPGDHHSVVEEPDVARLADILVTRIGE